MTTTNEKLEITKEQKKMEWQQVEYDADHSDVEGLFEMPCPVAPSHQNYPINSAIKDLNLSLELFQQLRRNGDLLPVDVLSITRLMQTFRDELNAVLEAVSSRHTPATNAENPVTERIPTVELADPRAVTEEIELEKPERKGILKSGKPSRKRKTRPSSKRNNGGRIETRKQEEPVRSSDSVYGSSPRNRPKSAEASIVKHKAKHKKHKLPEPTELLEFEPAQMNPEIEMEIKKIRRMFQGMLDGTLAKKEMNPQLQMMQKMVSDMLQINPDFSLMELVERQLNKFITPE